MPSNPTVRALARERGLSRSTVSNALRGAGRTAPETVERVQAAARAASYEHNPLAASVMSAMRRSRGGTFRGVIAAIELLEQDHSPHGPFHRELVIGATGRARELGFKLEQFVLGRDGLTMSRLDSVLQSRGITGVLLLPSWHEQDFTLLDWSRYTGVYTDYNRTTPELHTVCSDHYRSMIRTLEMLGARGYRRPGLCIERDRNDRLDRRHSAAFEAFRDDQTADVRPVPSLITPEITRRAFEPWFRHHKPDVVLCHSPAVIDWMESCGACLPDTHGFVCLNACYSGKNKRSFAKLDLQPGLIGARGVDLIVTQLQHNERGAPPSPTRTLMSVLWIDGPTVRVAPVVHVR